MVTFPSVFKSVANGLSKNTEALLVFGLGCVALGLAMAKVNEWLACLMPVGLYIMYILRQERTARHEMQMANIALNKLEIDRRNSLEKALAKIKVKDEKTTGTNQAKVGKR